MEHHWVRGLARSSLVFLLILVLKARYCRRQATTVVFVCGKLLLEMYGGLLGVLGLNKRRENPIHRRKIRMSIWIRDLLYLINVRMYDMLALM